jgi:hypothetical protein
MSALIESSRSDWYKFEILKFRFRPIADAQEKSFDLIEIRRQSLLPQKIPTLIEVQPIVDEYV